jgi:gamma-D-glutamyl-L-lysine dipeptidyl-peptidase
LLFFSGHVAIYIENGLFIHSSESIDGVAISSLNKDDDNYKKNLAENIISVGSLF